MEEIAGQQILFAVGINHKSASVEVREKVYIHEEEIPEFLAKLKETLTECVVLSTCNRTEIYGVFDSAEIDLDFYKQLIIDFKDASEVVKKEHFFSLISCAACQQLFKVSASVDSKIVGDTQILQQLRHAYAVAQDNGSTGKILNQLAQRAFKVGKKARTETDLHKGAISVSLAAVELAVEAFGSLKDKSVLIVGAGDTARLTAENLLKRNVGKISITNRTKVKARELLNDLHKSRVFESEIIEFDELKSRLNATDIVISSTSSPDYILRKSDFENQTNKILLIDIAVPRDIDEMVAENKNVILRNIDDLHSIVDKNFERRMKDMPRVKRIIATEMSDFLMWYYSLPLLPAFGKQKGKPDPETIEEIKNVKTFLAKNVAQLHKLARKSGGDSSDDLKNHLNLIEKLHAAKNGFLEGFES